MGRCHQLLWRAANLPATGATASALSQTRSASRPGPSRTSGVRLCPFGALSPGDVRPVLVLMPQARQNRARFVRGAPRDERNAPGMHASINRHIYRRRLALAALAIAASAEGDRDRRKSLSRLARRRANSADARSDWVKVAEMSIRVYGGEPEWPLAQAFIQWMTKHRTEAFAALQRLWLGARSNRTRQFARLLPPEKFPTPSIRVALASLLDNVLSDRLLRELQQTQSSTTAPNRGSVRLPGPTSPAATDGTVAPRPDVSHDTSGTRAETASHSTLDHNTAQPPGGDGRAAGARIATSAGVASDVVPHSQPNTVGVSSLNPKASHVIARVISIEASAARLFLVSPTDPPTEVERERREAALVGRYVDWLARHSVHAVRHEIKLPGLNYPFYTDLYDPRRSELIEAKASADREDIRMALGQLLDYGRYVSPPVARGTDPRTSQRRPKSSTWVLWHCEYLRNQRPTILQAYQPSHIGNPDTKLNDG